MRSLMGLSGVVLQVPVSLVSADDSDQLCAPFGAEPKGVSLSVLAGVVFKLESEKVTLEVSSCVP